LTSVLIRDADQKRYRFVGAEQGQRPDDAPGESRSLAARRRREDLLADGYPAKRLSTLRRRVKEPTAFLVPGVRRGEVEAGAVVEELVDTWRYR
jgi:hypothetical protein